MWCAQAGLVNERPGYLSSSGKVLYWQYNIDVRCADGMQNQWLIADGVGKGFRAAAFGEPGGGPLDVAPRSWQVAVNGSWVAEPSITLSAVRVYRAARQAVATLERDLDKLGRFQDPTEGGRFQKGDQVVTTQLVETGTGLRVKTALGWVSMVAVSGAVLLEPWTDGRRIDISGLTARKRPPSHRTAQKFAEVDGILGIVSPSTTHSCRKLCYSSSVARESFSLPVADNSPDTGPCCVYSRGSLR